MHKMVLHMMTELQKVDGYKIIIIDIVFKYFNIVNKDFFPEYSLYTLI